MAGGNLAVRIADGAQDEVGELTRSFDKMVDSLHASQRQLQRSTEFAENVLSSMRDPLLVISGDGEILRANAATLEHPRHR